MNTDHLYQRDYIPDDAFQLILEETMDDKSGHLVC